MDEPPKPSGRQAEDDGLNERKAILQSLFRGDLSSQLAAEQLSSWSLNEKVPEGAKGDPLDRGLLRTWQTILVDGKETSDHHEKLSELLVGISRLPPAKDEQGKQLMRYGLRVWDDLPMFAWELHDDWSYYAQRQADITTFVNVNKFAAQLSCSPHSIFAGRDGFGIWVLWLMRGALEYPVNDRELLPLEPLETYIPAAVAWVAILGSEIFSWDNEFPSGEKEGDPGKGGPLWDGQHGFCKERWHLWKRRFTELSTSKELSKELRELATEGVTKMDEAESTAA